MALNATLIQMARFGAVGLLNTTLGLAAIYACMYFLHIRAEIANLLGYAVGLSVGFGLNKRWTFASQHKVGAAAQRYGVVVCAAYLVNLAFVSLAARSEMNPYLAQLCGVGSYTTVCFVGCRYYAFATNANVTTKC
jgi:putative flippase GtrA